MLRPFLESLAQRHALALRERLDDDGAFARRTLERLDDEPLRVAPCVVERRRLAEPPGGHRRQQQLFAEELAAQLGQIAEQRARLEHAGAERIGEQHVAAPRAVGEAGDAERGVGAQLERVAVVVVLAANDGVHALEAADRLEPDAVVAHGEVASFHQREAEVARQQRMFEVGLVVGPRREQHDARRAALTRRTRCPVAQRRAQGVEECGQVLHRQLAEHLREHARDDEPVLERVARTRRSLRAVAHHPPPAVGRAREVGGVLQQVAATGGLEPFGRREEAAVAEDHRRRDESAFHQRLRAIEIAEHAVEQVGPLLDAGRDAFPLVGGQQERDRIDLPRPLGTGRIGIHVVGDAELADLPLGERERVADFAFAALGKRAREGIPVGARLARSSEQLVVAVLRRRVAREQLIEHGAAGHVAWSVERGGAAQATARRRSRVNGKSGFSRSAGIVIVPGVWPVRKNRARRRASASSALTGKVV